MRTSGLNIRLFELLEPIGINFEHACVGGSEDLAILLSHIYQHILETIS